MIKGNFYPSESVTTVGTEFTKFVPQIPIETESAPNAYWLGWISVDNVPQALHPSEIVVNDTQYIFRDITPAANFDCGYNFSVPPDSTYNSDRDFGLSHYIESIEKWRDTRGSHNSYNFCFGNKVDVMDNAISAVQFYEFYVIYDAGGNRVRTTSTIGNMHQFTYEEFISFLNGESFKSYYGDYGNITISKNDFVNGIVYKQTTTGHYAQIFLAGYRFTPTRSTSSDDSSNYPGVSAAFMVHIPTEKYGDAIISGLHTTQNPVISWDPRTPTTAVSATVLSGLHATFNIADVATLSPYDGGNFLLDGNVFLYSDFENQVKANAIYTIEDVEKHFNLCSRMSKARSSTDPATPYYGYILNDVYAPYITDENEFTATRITGSLSDDEFKEKLRKWQYDETEWAENDYTEDKKPEYGPQGDEDPFGGANWLTNSFPYGGTDGFVTQYVLTESQLQSFGANLWAKFFTQDFWESICVILPESLSINASDILNYIVSLREYPFDVTAVGNCVSDDPVIFIGRGIVGVTVSGNAIHRMLEYNGHISIESNPIEPYFGDFRDYEPCTRITLFVPFCGVVELTPSQVIGGTITLRYSIDFSTGAIQCTVQVNRGAFTTNLNTLSGTVGANVQMSASNLTQVLQKGAGMVANFAKSTALFAIGMGEVGAAEGAIASAESEQEIANAVGKYQHGASTAQSAFSVPDLNGVPVPVFGQSGGFASFQITEPMIQRTYHYYEIPSNYAHVYGYACNKTVTLSTLEGKGFTVCKNVDLSGIPATQDELNAIESLLTSGVYF